MRFSEELLSQITNNLFTEPCLKLNDCEIDDEMAVKLAKALKQNTYIKEVSLQNNNIGERGAIALSEVSTLESLNLGSNKIQNNGLQALLKSYLIVLDVSGNGITDAGLEGIEQNEFLSELNLGTNNITAVGCEGIAKNTGLAYLDLSFNNIGNGGAIFLSKSTSITELVLYKANITAEGAMAFGNNHMLEKLVLSFNQIGTEGVYGLSKNKTITDLSLTHNKLTNLDIKPLMTMGSLAALDLSYNEITDVGALELLSKFSPDSLSLSGNKIVMAEKPPLTQFFNTKKEEEQKKDKNVLSEFELFITAFRKSPEKTKFEVMSMACDLPDFNRYMQELKNVSHDDAKRQKLED